MKTSPGQQSQERKAASYYREDLPQGHVCLYGTKAIGFGWLANDSSTEKTFGPHMDVPMATQEDAIQNALKTIRAHGIRGPIAINSPKGRAIRSREA